MRHNPRCAIFNYPPSLRDDRDCNCGVIPPLPPVRCSFTPSTPGWGPCSRESGHSGPCAHPTTAPISDQVMLAQADLRSALGMLRMYRTMATPADLLDTVEDGLERSLARLHTLLDNLGRPPRNTSGSSSC